MGLIEYEKAILEAIDKKGWNAYRRNNPASTLNLPISDVARMREELIKAGPATHLEVEERYVMFPKANDSKDPVQVIAALEGLEERLSIDCPTIEINGQVFPWTGFKPRIGDVKVITSFGHHISYEQFVRALGTIIQA